MCSYFAMLPRRLFTPRIQCLQVCDSVVLTMATSMVLTMMTIIRMLRSFHDHDSSDDDSNDGTSEW